MNNSMNSQMIVKERLLDNPMLAYQIKYPEPQTLSLSEYQKTAFPAILGNYTGMSILNIEPKWKLGEILSFDAQPRNRIDPIIIYCPYAVLQPYYNSWGDIIQNGIRKRWRHDPIKNYDDAIKIFIDSAKQSLSLHEIVFAVIEMLKFKNDVILNPNFFS